MSWLLKLWLIFIKVSLSGKTDWNGSPRVSPTIFRQKSGLTAGSRLESRKFGGKGNVHQQDPHHMGANLVGCDQ